MASSIVVPIAGVSKISAKAVSISARGLCCIDRGLGKQLGRQLGRQRQCATRCPG